MANPEEFAGVLVILTAAYPMFQIPRETTRLYAKELSDVPVVDLLQAAEAHIKQCRFFPTIAELRGPWDEKRVRTAKEDRGREWKENLERYEQEALSAGEAKKMLTAFVNAANGKGGAAIVPFRGGRGMKRILAEPVKKHEVGAEMTDEQWEERKERLKEGTC